MKRLLLSGVVIALALGFSGCSKYEPSPNMVELKAEFVKSKWNGNRVPKDEVCSNYNKKAGSTPAIKITNLPKGSTKVILTFNDLSVPKMASGGHGVLSYDVSNSDSTVIIPSMMGETFDLPNGFSSIQAHKAALYFGKTPGAYIAPCSGGRGNIYDVKIEAIHEYTDADKKPILLGDTKLRLGTY